MLQRHKYVRVVNMRKLYSWFCAVSLIPLLVSSVSVFAGEKTYVLNSTNGEVIDESKYAEACWFVYQLGDSVLDAARADLYSIQTRSSRGNVVNDSVRKVGELITCQRLPTNPPDLLPPVVYPGDAESLGGGADCELERYVLYPG